MAGRVKTWVWVVAGIVVVCFLGVVAMAAVGMYLFTKHIDTREISPASASQEFDEIKAIPIGRRRRIRSGPSISTCWPSIQTTTAS